jgi:outer membrane protein W
MAGRTSSIVLLFNLLPLITFSQIKQNVFEQVTLRVDTSTYSTQKNALWINQEEYLPFQYDNEDEVVEVELLSAGNFTSIPGLVESGDFALIDSLLEVNPGTFRFKVQFRNLTRCQFLKFTFRVQMTGDSIFRYSSINLFPYTETRINFFTRDDELFIGEEKIFELSTNNIENIKVTNEWTSGQDIDYMISEKLGQLQLHLLPRSLGRKKVQVKLQTNKPFLNRDLKPDYGLPVITQEFIIKNSRLAFLNMDKVEVTLDEKSRTEGIEIQLDDSRSLVLNKTYRLENQEQPGGVLIAELFTRNSLANNRVLCTLRPYNYHRNSQGYLYIKDGDEARFITNVSITPKTRIDKVSIMHEGQDWSESLICNPGEIINVRIEGEGLHKARFNFEDAIDLSSDSLIRSENLVMYKLKIPVDISKRRISLYNHSENTGTALIIREYQLARPFDYMFINYGDIDRNVATLKSPIIYSQNVKDIIFSFVPRRIDEEQLYGKQYLKMDIKITNSKNQLVDLKTIDNIVVCPGENSPRYQYYVNKDCIKDDISLNNYLSKKTYDLEDWAKIDLTIENKADKYAGDINTKKIELILQKKYKFDIDVSFPAGLITATREVQKDSLGKVTGHTTSYGGLYGISMAIIAQFSFYEPDKIGKLKPFKVGAGFLAMDAFNFSENSKRDVGLVLIGSLYPVNRESKFSFPLYLGAGYLLKGQQFFFLLGPGIRVSL